MKHCPNHVWKSKASDRFHKANRVIYHAGTGNDGGLASPSDFIECSGHGQCHHDGAIPRCSSQRRTMCIVLIDALVSFARTGLINSRRVMGTAHPQRLGQQGEDLNQAGTCECVWPYFGSDCSQQV